MRILRAHVRSTDEQVTTDSDGYELIVDRQELVIYLYVSPAETKTVLKRSDELLNGLRRCVNVRWEIGDNGFRGYVAVVCALTRNMDIRATIRTVVTAISANFHRVR